ncbi:Mannan endo-1 [Phytophthora citrophthora]|uniref:mannan endo-1,4-beta-mannosidase n=1 Tax=Phytophthora citrophthora TaxID=4793 RepID=A0AAD9G0S8_9STRA|nr:Mannan endo-1 [Phytophthora citrophthora]
MIVFSSAAVVASLALGSASAGFVTTSGTNFQLDGSPFYIFGTNAYWASEIQWSSADLATIFNTMAKNDITVCRTWGFADLTETGNAPYNIVYQLWKDGNATINTGNNGLGYFDKVVAAAKAAGVKLVVPFVNNWSDYGGMDVYVKQLGGKYHDDFYTNKKIKDAYKHFVRTFVKRYAKEDTIMAWQLCNECRCAGSEKGLKESGKCTTKTINAWMTEMAAYIKVLDSNHLVATGSEGFMNSDKSVYVYSGPSGVDFDQNLAIKSIDYGTYHAYPDSWGVAESEHLAWGEKWIKDHIASGKKAGKPVVLEEYGAKSQNAKVYNAWSDAVYAGASNMQYWDFGLASLKNYKDGYTIYDTDELFKTAIVPAAKKFKARGGSN